MTVAGLESSPGDVLCSRNIVIKSEKSVNDVKDQTFDAVVLPGGLGGSKAMASNSTVGEIIRKQFDSGRLLAAICAAPIALHEHKIGFGMCITSYPAFKEQLEKDYTYVPIANVVKDANLITSKGPGTAFDFALKIADELVGFDKAKEVAQGLLLTY